VYHARRVALAAKLHGGVAVLFAAEEPQLDFMPYRQDEDFYYLTGWNEPGAALLIVGDAPKANSARVQGDSVFAHARPAHGKVHRGQAGCGFAGRGEAAGVDAVQPMTELPAVLNRLIDADRRLAGTCGRSRRRRRPRRCWALPRRRWAVDASDAAHDVTKLTGQLRAVKDAGEIALLKEGLRRVDCRAAGDDEGREAGRDRARAGRQDDGGVDGERLRAGVYAPIVGSGINSTVLHYSENTRTLEDGDILLVDAACEYSMYASDITRTVPVNGHFTARQREIYNIVLGAQQAAIDAFVAGKSKINDRDRRDPDSLDTAAYNYINTHGKDLHGQPLGSTGCTAWGTWWASTFTIRRIIRRC
jgi:Xaa-Pro aminopeptidase